MDIPIPFGAYTGKPTPFGGASLEWAFESRFFISDEPNEDARFSVRNLPFFIGDTMVHIRRAVDLESLPNTTASVQRVVLSLGIPLIEQLVSGNPKIIDRMEKAYLSSSPNDSREMLIRRSSNYVLQLGPSDHRPHAVFARTKDQVSKVQNISEDLGMFTSRVVILCLTAGLAQSLDEIWVPKVFRDLFISEIKFFEKWLRS